MAVAQQTDLLTWGGEDVFTPTLLVGPTATGKTQLLKNLLQQLILAKKEGKQVGFTVVESTGELSRFVQKTCAEHQVEYHCLAVKETSSSSFNVFQGSASSVANMLSIAVKQSFNQDPFFVTLQDELIRNTVRLLKAIFKDRANISDLLETIASKEILMDRVLTLKRLATDPDLVRYYEETDPELISKLGVGLRLILEDILSPEYPLKAAISGESTIDLQEHMNQGGILTISADKIHRAGDMFVRLMSMHVQQAACDRSEDQAKTPHFFIVEELWRHMHSYTENFVNSAPQHKVAGIFTTQCLGQLGAFTKSQQNQQIIKNCRNKIFFSPHDLQEVRYILDELGYQQEGQGPNTFNATDLMFMPHSQFVYKLMQEGQPTVGFARSSLHDWPARSSSSTVHTPQSQESDPSYYDHHFEVGVNVTHNGSLESAG